MALTPSEAYASKLAALAATLPHIASLQAATYDAADGKTYYYAIYRLPGDTLNRQTIPSPSPLSAYRETRAALLSHLQPQSV